MTDHRNRPDSSKSTDHWLTPREIIEALGPFDLDPACPPVMPWRTAARMVHAPEEDGLAIDWSGRVWCNPPWSNPLPWVQKMSKHGNGIMLTPAKSTDTKWGQELLCSCDAVLFLAGRPLFHYMDGRASTGKWTSVLLAAWGQRNVNDLHGLAWKGVLMERLML